jgi:hypothetical protein
MTHYISQIYILKSVSNRSQSPRCVQQISETPHRPWTPNLILGYIRELRAFSRIVIPKGTCVTASILGLNRRDRAGSRSHHEGVEGQHRE